MARVCLIRQGFFPLDTRVRREVGALEAAGHEVDVICLQRAGEPRRERRGAVRVLRLPLTKRRAGPAWYVLQYALFLISAAVVVTLLHARRRFDVVQVNSLPDVLVFAAVAPKALGARVLLDLHECMPEFFSVKYGVGGRHPAVRLLARLEQASIRFADMTITCTDQMREAFIARGAPPDRLAVVLNSSDEAIFDRRRHPPNDNGSRERFTLIAHGAIEESYGPDTILRAAALVRPEIPGLRVSFYGDGTYRPEVQRLVRELGLTDVVTLSEGFAPIDELVQAIADADAGVVAVRRNVFRDLTHCNKMFDFVAMHRPAIVSRTRAVEAYFDESCFLMFDSADEHDLAAAIRRLYREPDLGPRLAARAAEVADGYRWATQRQVYQGVVQRLAERRR